MCSSIRNGNKGQMEPVALDKNRWSLKQDLVFDVQYCFKLGVYGDRVGCVHVSGGDRGGWRHRSSLKLELQEVVNHLTQGLELCSGPLQKQHTLVTLKAKQGLLPVATLQSRHFSK